ncbi:uncharacterized protein LOC107036040 [Diachasma alloeum]|uniref:uncharacterized protein LOC107036040 n=1 Tax=Diachasma alloeum TaxID=454923 RepID=UPI0007383B87|nr:uncharacterized protein LOC107036040 [Diachasma alloeum]
MNDRSDHMKMGRLERTSGLSRKPKKRTSKKPPSPRVDWCSEDQNDGSEASVPPLDYGGMFWQQPGAIPPHMQPHNGQRLFTAMSDPSVCRYSAVPMAYTMEPVSMPPMYPLYRPVPQPNYRPFRGRGRRHIQHHQNVHGIVNGYSSLQENRTSYMTPHLYQNGDYASLPPTANNEGREQVGEMSSEHRRYSDPGLGPPELENCRSDESDSGESGSSITTVGKNNKLVLSLVEQMTNLRESNSQMFKELHETKLSLENVKAELSRVKQQTSLDYQPGMLSDIIGEMRQANKILEETMNARISAIIEEKNNQRLLELEEVKERLAKITEEKSDGDKRIAKLEEEVARLSINANNEGREIAAFEEETLALRRELQEARSSRHLAENYATKCVNEAIMPCITPVTFDNSCITSTPVRTDTQASSSVTSSPPSSLSPSNSSRIPSEETNWQWQGPTERNSPDDNSKDEDMMSSRKESMQSLEPDEREALDRLINYHLERKQSLPEDKSSETKNRRETVSRCNSECLENSKCFRHRNISNCSSSESDPDRFIKCSSKAKPRRKRGLSDIPDVVFVTGEPLVPKDLCSTRILTSRVLTAPSRATYTTAYI